MYQGGHDEAGRGQGESCGDGASQTAATDGFPQWLEMSPAHADQRAREPETDCCRWRCWRPSDLVIRCGRRGHDPATRLDFRPIRVASQPRALPTGGGWRCFVIGHDIPVRPWTLLHHQSNTDAAVILLLLESRRLPRGMRRRQQPGAEDRIRKMRSARSSYESDSWEPLP